MGRLGRRCGDGHLQLAPMMRIRPSVNLSGIRPELVLAICITRTYFFGMEITSVMDGEHMPGSLHYVGCAFDFTHGSMTETRCNALREALGPQFDVVMEIGHIHVEFQPK